MAKRRAPVRKMSPALTRIAKRAITASPDEVRVYAPRELDLQIAEVLLSGELPAISYKAIAEEVGTHATTVSKALKDPVSCGWIFQMVHREIKNRLGMVDAAMFLRASSGDTRAASILYKRYGEMVDRSLHIHAQVGDFNVESLGDADLDALIKSKGVLDAEFEVINGQPQRVAPAADEQRHDGAENPPGDPDDGTRAREQQSGFRDYPAPGAPGEDGRDHRETTGGCD